MNQSLYDWYIDSLVDWSEIDSPTIDYIEPQRQLVRSPLSAREQGLTLALEERSAAGDGVTHHPVISSFGGTPVHWIAMPVLLSGVRAARKHFPVAFREMPM
jgi:hypothetical protein